MRPSLPIAGDLPAQDTVGQPAEERMISLTRTGRRCLIRLVKAVPELDDLISVLLPVKRLTASTDSAICDCSSQLHWTGWLRYAITRNAGQPCCDPPGTQSMM